MSQLAVGPIIVSQVLAVCAIHHALPRITPDTLWPSDPFFFKMFHSITGMGRECQIIGVYRAKQGGW
jgi:hypothetical protein